ncbi:MAG: enhanced serine sensitivity protein SseB C-terminal domain-containing protein [Oscillospiraceae bacterium]|nr:enhanced serine sensitivity protein SseB C-terminal domain-containing protein [Oscillospiraceae bacterium]
MSTIQELTVKLSQTAEPNEREELSGQIVNQLKNQETIWAAFCPATKHYFLAQEDNQLTAYLFSTEETCRAFTDALRKRHIMLEVLKNEQEHRMYLFAELFRCGVVQVVIDSAEDYYAVSLDALIPIPDYSKLPLVQRPVLNPVVTGKMLLLTQDIRWGRADGNTELDALQEIYHSPFLHPFRKNEDGSEESAIYQLPDNGGSLFMIFTDLYSLKQASPTDYPNAKIVRFADLHKMPTDNPDKMGIIINPSSGAPMLLDMQLLELTQKSAEGDLSEVSVRSMNENSGKTIVTKPEIPNHDMENHLTEYFQENAVIKRAWLRTIRKEEEIRPHYLVILDWMDGIEKEERKDIRRKLSQIALPFARGLHIDYVSYHYDHGKAWTGSSEPFYESEFSEPQISAPEEDSAPASAEPENTPPKKPVTKKKGLFSSLFSKK